MCCCHDSCDGSPQWPCLDPSSCAGHRAGPLCGRCIEGFAESLGSEQCVEVVECPKDRALLWPGFMVVLMFAAVAQLSLVSGVWKPSMSFPSGKAKLVIYYAQARRCTPVRVVCVCVCG